MSLLIIANKLVVPNSRVVDRNPLHNNIRIIYFPNLYTTFLSTKILLKYSSRKDNYSLINFVVHSSGDENGWND